MDPRLDSKWNGQVDPRTALPLDKWTRERIRREKSLRSIPFSWEIFTFCIVSLAVLIGAGIWQKNPWIIWIHVVMLIVILGATLFQWLIKE